MHERRKVCLFFICSAMFRIGFGEVLVTPLNVAVIVGDPMVMECRATPTAHVFKWTVASPTTKEKLNIFKKREGEGCPRTNPKLQHFGCDMDSQGSGFIYSNSTELKDAGLYTCFVFNSERKEFQATAHLIVFEARPTCETNYTVNYTVSENTTLTTNDLIQMHCNVSFRGFWSPEVEWRQHIFNGSDADEGQVVTDGIFTETTANSHISTTLIVVPDFVHSTFFSCKFFFTKRNENFTATAANIPALTFLWEFPEMKPLITWTTGVVETVDVEYVSATVKNPDETSTLDGGNRNTNWRDVSVLLSVALLVIILSIAGIIAWRCYVGCRNIRGLEIRTPAPSATHLRRLERPPSGTYDVIPFATPNIYDSIEENDVNANGTMQPQTECQGNIPVTHCYSGLSSVTPESLDAYDALSPYLPMNKPGFHEIKTSKFLAGTSSHQKKECEEYVQVDFVPTPGPGEINALNCNDGLAMKSEFCGDPGCNVTDGSKGLTGEDMNKNSNVEDTYYIGLKTTIPIV